MFIKGPKLICSVRFLVVLLCFFLNGFHYMQKINLSVGIVCMVDHSDKSAYLNQSLMVNETKNGSDVDPDGILKKSFDWSKRIQGIILGSIFLGSLSSQVFAGWLSLKVGSKLVILVSMAIASTLTVLTPFVASISYYALILVRFLIGLMQGSVTSSINVILACWVPPLERSTLLAISNSGSLLGNAIALLTGGILCESGIFGGWPSIFFLTGGLGLIWCFLWIIMVSDSPEHQKCISLEEKEYIVEKTKDFSYKAKEKKIVPWKKIFTSKAVLGLILTNLCGNFGISLFITCLPTYMNDVLKFGIALNGELSAIPFFTCWLSIIFSGVVSDKMIRSNRFSRLFVRKLFNSIGFVVPILTFFGLIFVDHHSRTIGVVLILLNITFAGFQFGSGYFINFNEIGGSLAGIIYGVANTISGATAILAPFLMGFLTANNTRAGWTLMFVIAIVIGSIGTISFILFAECEIQSWAKNDNLKVEEPHAENEKFIDSKESQNKH